MKRDRLTRVGGLVIGGLGPIAVAGLLVGVRGELVNANVALALVVVVVLAAITGGRAAGALAAVVATLSFDFFHTEPYLRLTIDSANDVETTLLLLVVGLTVGELARAAAAGAAAARRSEIGRIRRVADLAARGDDPVDVLMAAQAELVDLLELEHCFFQAPAALPVFARLERGGALDQSTFRFDHRTREFELPVEGVELPVMGRGTQLGRFVLEPSPGTAASLEQRVVAVAIADQVGAALAAPHPRPQQEANHA